MATALAMTRDPAAERREAFQEKLMESARGAFNIFTMYLGDRLGYYEALARSGAMTPAELAEETGTHARYAREWMEQQTVAGLLEVDDARAPAEKRRFWLPAGHDEVLAESDAGDLDEFRQLMDTMPEWADGLQLKVSGWKGRRYRK